MKTALITGETRSDHEFSEETFKCVRIDNRIQKYEKLVEKLLRSREIDSLVGETRELRFKEQFQITAKTTLKLRKPKAKGVIE